MELLDSSDSSGPDSPGILNCGLLLEAAEMSVLVPETPSPQRRRGRRFRGLREVVDSPSSELRRAKRRRMLIGSAQNTSQSWILPLSPSSSSSSSSSSDSSSSSSATTASSSSSSSSSSASSAPETRDAAPAPAAASLSFLTDEERRWIDGGPEAELIVIADDEDAELLDAHQDDIEEGLRQVQEEEDAAFAQSLQAQFDREETATGSRPTARHHGHHYSHHSHHHHHHRPSHHMMSDTGWMPRFLAGLSPLLTFEDHGGRPQSRRERSRRRRRSFSQMEEEDDYEALLEFEGRQGSVVNKKLSRSQIEMFPTRVFQSAGAGATQCQICFCDYVTGETLRILPCFHDYHAPCIDRWLKDNITCPICRVDLMELQEL